MKTAIGLLLTAFLAACGLTETATTAAVSAKSQADQVEQAKAVEQKMLSDIQQAQQQADQRLRDADAK